jgi:hypothetical protein
MATSSKTLGIAAVALGLLGGAAGAQPGAPLPQLFPVDNWWNTDVSQAPIDPQSASFLSFIGTGGGMHPDFGGDVDPNDPSNPGIYGMVWVVVPGTQSLVPVTFDIADESDPGAPGRPAGYPIPPEAITEPHWIEGGYPGDQDQGDDQHLLIVDRDHHLLFETWQTRYNPNAGRWEAGSGAVFDLDSNARRPEGWTSADAAGLAILPGLVRYDEAMNGAPIRHAFRFTVRDTRAAHVFPASHTACNSCPPEAPPMGTRLRLKASVDLARYPPYLQRIFQAMKTYGLILADNGSDMYISGAYDARWNNDELNPAFASLTAGDFEVVQLGWKPSGGGGGGGTSAPTAPSDLTAAARTNRRVRLAWKDNAANEDSYRVEMSRTGQAFREIRSLPANTTSFLVTGLTPNTGYGFRIRAHGNDRFSAYSNRADVQTPR